MLSFAISLLERFIEKLVFVNFSTSLNTCSTTFLVISL